MAGWTDSTTETWRDSDSWWWLPPDYEGSLKTVSELSSGVDAVEGISASVSTSDSGGGTSHFGEPPVAASASQTDMASVEDLVDEVRRTYLHSVPEVGYGTDFLDFTKEKRVEIPDSGTIEETVEWTRIFMRAVEDIGGAVDGLHRLVCVARVDDAAGGTDSPALDLRTLRPMDSAASEDSVAVAKPAIGVNVSFALVGIRASFLLKKTSRETE